MKTVRSYKRSILSSIGLVAIMVGMLIPATALAAPQAGADPNFPIAVSLAAGQTVIETGQLAAGQEVWYAMTVNDTTGRYVNEGRSGNIGVDRQKISQDQPALDLTLFVTGANGNSVNNVRMDLFPASYARHWSHGHIYVEGLDDNADGSDAHSVPFGASSVVDRDGSNEGSLFSLSDRGDTRLGQQTWSGRVDNNQPFLILVRNENASPVDYSFYTASIANIEF